MIEQIEGQISPDSFTELMNRRISSIPDHGARIALRLYTRKVLSTFEESRTTFISEMMDSYEEACHCYREQFSIACLSEELGSTSMWGLYAASGAGYCVEYDLRNFDRLNCSCGDCCCRSGNQLLPIYPVIYNGQFDATRLSHVVMNKYHYSPLPTAEDYLVQVNALVHKASNWSFEGEWRVVAVDCDHKGEAAGGRMYANLQASSIYLGYNISSENEQKLRSLSKETGIQLYRVEEDNSSRTAAFRYSSIER